VFARILVGTDGSQRAGAVVAQAVRLASVSEAPSDLLIVGHRGVRGVRRAMLGSVSERCARDAACSVLVSRPARVA
jgi:universal stress protein E